jgi:hypothetical protein
MQIGRGVGLIAIAAVIGIVLLHHNGPTTSATTVSAHATTTAAPSHAPSTTATTPPTTGAALRPPSSVKVLVANGTAAGGGAGVSQHLATTVSQTLHSQGYDTLAPLDATQKVTATIVYFQPGYEREAAVLAQSAGLPVSAVQSMPAQPPVPSLNGANILVVAGPDLAAKAATSTTTTTAHGATTTIPTTATTARAATTTVPTTRIPTTTTVHP